MANNLYRLRQDEDDISIFDEPVSLIELKNHLNLSYDFTQDDILLLNYIRIARIQCEDYCNRYFIPNTPVKVLFENIQSKALLPPDSTIISILVDGITLTEDQYTFDSDFREIIMSGTKVKITITTGKSNPKANQAILYLASDFYENRTTEFLTGRNKFIESILSSLRVNIGI